MGLESKKEIVEYCIQKKILITPALLSSVSSVAEVVEWLRNRSGQQPSTLASAVPPSHSSKNTLPPTGSYELVMNYTSPPKKRSVQDFVTYFRSRASQMEKFLSQRQELSGVTSISRALQKVAREKTVIIGLVFETQVTKNDHFIFTLEDVTGTIKCFVGKDSPLRQEMNDLVLDEMVGVVGTSSGAGLFYVESVVHPDIPIVPQREECPDDVCGVVLSDIHVGSSGFLEDKFLSFLRWIRGEEGTPEQKEIAGKVRYLFIAGDTVDGMGVYPGQERNSTMHNINDQYEKLSKLLREIPSSILIFFSLGDHDAGRLSEPQPPLLSQFRKFFDGMNNVVFVSNPSIIKVHKTGAFSGVNVLIYHGHSFFYYMENIQSMKNSGKALHERADLAKKYFLQRRHLAPVYGSTLSAIDAVDALVLENVPDIFISGHVHRPSVQSYRGTLLISGSCWQAQSEFEIKVGQKPEPCIVPIIHLKSRTVTMLDFTEGAIHGDV